MLVQAGKDWVDGSAAASVALWSATGTAARQAGAASRIAVAAWTPRGVRREPTYVANSSWRGCHEAGGDAFACSRFNVPAPATAVEIAEQSWGAWRTALATSPSRR